MVSKSLVARRRLQIAGYRARDHVTDRKTRDLHRPFGARCWGWWLVALGLVMAAAAQAGTQDITGQFAITRSGLVLNRTSNTFDSTVTLKNTRSAPVLAPIEVVVGGLPAERSHWPTSSPTSLTAGRM